MGNITDIQVLKTASGVCFGLLGAKAAHPSPTLIVLASSLEETLGDSYFLQAGRALAPQGYLCVSLDLPCHGQERRSGEPEGLHGWRHRLEDGEDLMGRFKQRAAEMLDYLVTEQYTDPRRIAVCGTSRGGFAALHLLAEDARILCAAVMCPVTKLDALDEFRSMRDPHCADALSAMHLTDKLAGRAVWIVIGDQDDRVGTDNAIALARQLSSASRAKGRPSRVELHVLPEPRGHTTPAGAAAASAEWIARQLAPEDPG